MSGESICALVIAEVHDFLSCMHTCTALPSTPPVIALNNHDTTAMPISDPCELSYKLLNKLTNILKSESIPNTVDWDIFTSKIFRL